MCAAILVPMMCQHASFNSQTRSGMPTKQSIDPTRADHTYNVYRGYSKGLDNACPIGPVLVRASAINPDKLEHKGTLSGEVVQHSNTR